MAGQWQIWMIEHRETPTFSAEGLSKGRRKTPPLITPERPSRRLIARNRPVRLRRQLRPQEQLRGHLLGAARAAAQLLPSDNVVSLQEWVECRMPGEVELGTDDAGLVVLQPARLARDKVPDPALQSFLNRLPADQFLQEEEQGGQSIVNAITNGPETLAQVKRLGSVVKCTKVLLPAAIKLEDWIERRIGEEVAVESDERGQRICRLMGTSPPPAAAQRPVPEMARGSDDFIKTLPKDSFLPEEEKLRLAIFDFLAGWRAQELATLQHCAVHPLVAEAERGGDVALSWRINRQFGPFCPTKAMA
eukprot:g18783.t1